MSGCYPDEMDAVSREWRRSGARVAVKQVMSRCLSRNLMQRYDEHFTFSKIFRKNFSKKCIFTLPFTFFTKFTKFTHLCWSRFRP